MDDKEWEQMVPREIRDDSLWKMTAYRFALFAADLGWHDVSCPAKDRRMFSLSDQLYRALGSVSANLAEGYSRGTGKDRARFYEYAPGSARESRDRYFKARHILGETIVNHRLQLIKQIIRLTLTMVPQQRRNLIREESETYQIRAGHAQSSNQDPGWELETLLQEVPLPEE